MKPNPKEESRRWLMQAEHVLDVAKKLLSESCYAESCFHAEQAAQLSFKAFLYSKGERFITIHSVKQLAEQCATYDQTFQQLAEKGKVLDQYYIPTRYPDALTFPSLPYESYSKKQAQEAVEAATCIFNDVKQKLL